VPVGHAAFLPAAAARFPADEADLSHLWQLFVRREQWGKGVAATLHEQIVAQAAQYGFRAMRLFTPSEYPRARRFYERRGWRIRGQAFPDDGLGLPLVEYRLPLLDAAPFR
jgi:GNAT superfamily N-acetyltransferase